MLLKSVDSTWIVSPALDRFAFRLLRFLTAAKPFLRLDWLIFWLCGFEVEMCERDAVYSTVSASIESNSLILSFWMTQLSALFTIGTRSYLISYWLVWLYGLSIWAGSIVCDSRLASMVATLSMFWAIFLMSCIFFLEMRLSSSMISWRPFERTRL